MLSRGYCPGGKRIGRYYYRKLGTGNIEYAGKM